MACGVGGVARRRGIIIAGRYIDVAFEVGGGATKWLRPMGQNTARLALCLVGLAGALMVYACHICLPDAVSRATRVPRKVARIVGVGSGAFFAGRDGNVQAGTHNSGELAMRAADVVPHVPSRLLSHRQISAHIKPLVSPKNAVLP